MIIHQILKRDALYHKAICSKMVEGQGEFICVKYRDGWYNFYYYTKTFQGWTLLRGVINHSEEEAIEEFEKFVEYIRENDKDLEKYYEKLKEIRNEHK